MANPSVCFFKCYIPAISAEMLILPVSFSQKLQNALPERAFIKDQHWNIWEVKTNKIGDDWFFEDGWEKFVRHNSLVYGDVCVFSYNGDNIFYIKLFALSGLEKEGMGACRIIPVEDKDNTRLDFDEVEEEEDEGPLEEDNSEIEKEEDEVWLKGDYAQIEEEEDDHRMEEDYAQIRKEVDYNWLGEDNDVTEEQKDDVWLEEVYAQIDDGQLEKDEEVEIEEEHHNNYMKMEGQDDEFQEHFMADEHVADEDNMKIIEGGAGRHTIMAEAIENGSEEDFEVEEEQLVNDKRRPRVDPFGEDIFAADLAPKPKNPYFITRIRKARSLELFIPREVLTTFKVNLPHKMLLIDENGRKWATELCPWKDGRRCYKGGWRKLWKANLVQENDSCICEFVDDEECRGLCLRIHIIRANK